MASDRDALADLVTDAIGHGYYSKDVADAILADFLLIPHANVTTEYGIQDYQQGRPSLLVERAESRNTALATARRRRNDDAFEDRPHSRAVERLAPLPLAWTVIAEDGEKL